MKLGVNSKKHQTNLKVIAGLKDIHWTTKTVIAAVGNNLFNVTTHKIALWRNVLPVQEQFSGCKCDLKGSKKLPKIMLFPLDLQFWERTYSKQPEE